MCGLPIWAQIFLMPDRCKQQPKTRFSTCKTEVVHRCKNSLIFIPYLSVLFPDQSIELVISSFAERSRIETIHAASNVNTPANRKQAA